MIMTTQTIIDTEYATLWYYPESGIVHHEFHKYIHGDEFRNIMELGLVVFRQFGLRKWLSDDRKNSALPQADIDWAVANWIEPMVKSGWTYWGLVLPDKTVGRAPMMRVIEAYSQYGVQIVVFEDPSEAYQWLESVE